MIGIAISSYRDSEMTDRLIRSIKNKTSLEYKYDILVWDDGTLSIDATKYSKLVEVTNNHRVYLLNNLVNMGIPYTWNKLVSFFDTDKYDFVIILNNDVVVTNPNWLKYIEYVYKNNDSVGMIGYPLVNQGQFKEYNENYSWDTQLEKCWGELPGRVGASVGCCFSIQPKIWKRVKNPDGSIGFWESLISFSEEIHFGFKLYELGYINIMLNWPPFIHYGGMTFRNQELTKRQVDWAKIQKDVGGSKEEYINIISNSNIYPKGWPITWNKDNAEWVDRMAFSRYMFSKYWNVISDYDNPTPKIHNNILKINQLPKIPLHWLDKDMKERVDMV